MNGSGSEVRITTLNHPAMVIGLLELGSLVIDVDGDTLTARFLNSSAQVNDTFRIVKGTTCPPSPRPAARPGPKGKLVMKNSADPTKDKWIWKWKDGAIDAADLGDPTGPDRPGGLRL